MPKKCFFCGSTQLSSNKLLNGAWITENQFLGQHHQILKEITIGSTNPTWTQFTTAL